MNVRVLRLFQARRPFVPIPRRFVSTGRTPTPQNHVLEARTNSPPKPPSSDRPEQTPKFPKSDVLKVAKATSGRDRNPVPSDVHPTLQEGYKVGGRMTRGKLLHVHDNKGMPMWGEWGIPIRFVSQNRANTALL